MKNTKVKWCTIYEENSHDTRNCELNMKNKSNYHIIYQATTIDQNPHPGNTYINDSNNRHEGYRGHDQYNNNSTRRGPGGCFVCYKTDHLCTACPFKDKSDLRFYTKCGVNDHSLEDFPIMLEKNNGKKKH